MPRTPIVNRLWSERQFARGQSAQETYEVSGVASDNDAVAAVGITEGASHEQDARLKIPLAGGIDVSNVSPILYKIRYSYATDAPTLQGNPLDEPAFIVPQLVRSSEPIDRDYKGNPITNSARDPFSGGMTVASASMSITIAQYESTLDAQKILAYTYPYPTLNEDAVTIPQLGTFQPHQLLLVSASVDEGFSSRVVPNTYPRIIYQLEARGYRYFESGDYVSGFALRALDQGPRGVYGDGSGNLKIGPIVYGKVDKNGDWLAVGSDVLLDGYGGALGYPKYVVASAEDPQTTFSDPPPGAVLEETDNGCFLYYLVNKPMPFSGLGFKFG